MRRIGDNFYMDVAIWESKTRIDRPLLCEGDGPIVKLRRWYEQFYTDLDEVPAGLAERTVWEHGQETRPPRRSA